MGKKRKHRKDLPERMYHKHGAYYYVRPDNGKWVKLGRSIAEALVAYSGMVVDSGDDIRTMGQVVDRYIAEVLPSLGDKTQLAYGGYCRIIKETFGEARPTEITPQMVYKFCDILAKHRGAPTSKFCRQMMSNLFNCAIRWGIASHNVCTDVKNVKQPPARDRYVTDDEFRQLYEAAPLKIKYIMDIAYLTALRISDILKIRLSDISETELKIVIRKTGKKVNILLSEELRAAIARAKEVRSLNSVFLFTERSGEAYKYANFNYHFMCLKKQLGLQDANIHFHDLRGKALTDYAAQGGDAQKLAGHKSREMTERYIKDRAVDKVSPLDRTKNK